MYLETILEEMEKITATATGVLVSIILGEQINQSTEFQLSWPLFVQFAFELITKATIAVVSGAATYMAIHYLKKLLHHKTD